MIKEANRNFGQLLRSLKLDEIAGFQYESPLPGGGTNLTALFQSPSQKAVAKFFFMGPHPLSEKKFRNEVDNHKRARQFSTILPEFLSEFQSEDGFLRGYLMEYIDGTPLDAVIPPEGLGETHQLHGAFYRVTWAYHEALRLHVHGDLHPGNILFETCMGDWLTRKPESPEVRILDLGASIFPYSFNHDETFDEEMWTDHHRRFAGSFYSLAPEFLTERFTRSMQFPGTLDCWTLGLLLYKMTTGSLLEVASSLGNYAAQIADGRLQRHLDSVINNTITDYHLKALQKRMLRVDPTCRMDLTTATTYISLLYRSDPELLGRRGRELEEFINHGCDPEWHLAPHERSNSPY